MRRIAVVDAPSNLGLRPPTATSVPGCAKAPGSLRDSGLLGRLGARDAGCITPPRYDPAGWQPGDGVAQADEIAVFVRRLADRIGAVLASGDFPLILGGDCSILLGAGLAMRRYSADLDGRVGLVYVDGHSDFRHEGNASYVGAAAGEALALATGRGQSNLASIEQRRPYFRDVDVVLLGIRTHDEYRLDLQAAGIVARAVPELRSHGAARSAQWARDQLRDCAGFWVHVDVDVLDPAVMPAVDAPDVGGIAYRELEILLSGLVSDPRCVGVQVTVFDPDYDPDGQYAREVTDVLVAGLEPLVTSSALAAADLTPVVSAPPVQASAAAAAVWAPVEAQADEPAADPAHGVVDDPGHGAVDDAAAGLDAEWPAGPIAEEAAGPIAEEQAAPVTAGADGEAADDASADLPVGAAGDYSADARPDVPVGEPADARPDDPAGDPVGDPAGDLSAVEPASPDIAETLVNAVPGIVDTLVDAAPGAADPGGEPVGDPVDDPAGDLSAVEPASPDLAETWVNSTPTAAGTVVDTSDDSAEASAGTAEVMAPAAQETPADTELELPPVAWVDVRTGAVVDLAADRGAGRAGAGRSGAGKSGMPETPRLPAYSRGAVIGITTRKPIDLDVEPPASAADDGWVTVGSGGVPDEPADAPDETAEQGAEAGAEDGGGALPFGRPGRKGRRAPRLALTLAPISAPPASGRLARRADPPEDTPAQHRDGVVPFVPAQSRTPREDTEPPESPLTDVVPAARTPDDERTPKQR